MATLNPLVTTTWLTEHLGDETLRIADCRFYLDDPGRGYAEYVAGHIPGANYFSLDEHLTGRSGPGRHPLPDAAAFTRQMAASGIGNDHTVAVYDDSGAGIAARMWWMLRSLGHADVVVLDGGWSAWRDEDHPVATTQPQWEPAVFTGAQTWSGTVDRERVADPTGGLTLIDSRAATRYRGEFEPIDPVAGHIPGAINIPYQENVDATGRFRSAQQLVDRFAAVSAAETVVAYCGSGVTACTNLLAMEVAGITGALLYPGSWSDWCAAGGDVATA